jgi:hypothetical protein
LHLRYHPSILVPCFEPLHWHFIERTAFVTLSVSLAGCHFTLPLRPGPENYFSALRGGIVDTPSYFKHLTSYPLTLFSTSLCADQDKLFLLLPFVFLSIVGIALMGRQEELLKHDGLKVFGQLYSTLEQELGNISLLRNVHVSYDCVVTLETFLFPFPVPFLVFPLAPRLMSCGVGSTNPTRLQRLTTHDAEPAIATHEIGLLANLSFSHYTKDKRLTAKTKSFRSSCFVILLRFVTISLMYCVMLEENERTCTCRIEKNSAV